MRLLTADRFRASSEAIYQAMAVPKLIGIGPHRFSTSLALERWPSVIWDVNAYYATLGISPHATKREIREAYQRLDGHDSRRLTFIIKQLLNDEVRRAYDACRFNTLFYDRDLDHVFKQRVKDEARRKGQMEEAQPTSVETPEDELNHEAGVIDDEEYGDLYSNPNQQWDWGFYLWHTATPNVDLVKRWQHCVYQVFLGQDLSLSVGLMGGKEIVKLIKVEGDYVAFINEFATPSIPLAKTLKSKLST
jgi:hypothetical protein